MTLDMFTTKQLSHMQETAWQELGAAQDAVMATHLAMQQTLYPSTDYDVLEIQLSAQRAVVRQRAEQLQQRRHVRGPRRADRRLILFMQARPGHSFTCR